MHEAKKHFFISYNKADITWAEWIAWELEAEGYCAIVQAWDFTPGSNFVTRMRAGLEKADRVIAVLSQDYLDGKFTQAEWNAAFRKDPTGEKGLLLPVKVRDCDPEALLDTIVYIDLVNVAESDAKARLIAGAKNQRTKPPVKPNFPGAPEPESRVFPGELSRIWNVPHPPVRRFYGRDGLLAEMHVSLILGEAGRARGLAVYGQPGVGKTQIVTEYAYRYRADYDSVVWWVRGGEAGALAADYAALYRRLGLAPKDTNDHSYMSREVLRWLEGNDGWLLVFDNAAKPDDIGGFVPQKGGGNFLITSRNAGWGSLCAERLVEPLTSSDAADFLLNLKRTA